MRLQEHAREVEKVGFVELDQLLRVADWMILK
jgi:hypothetical protein